MNLQDVIGEVDIDYNQYSAISPGGIDFKLEEGRESKAKIDLTAFVLPADLPRTCEIHVTIMEPGLPISKSQHNGKSILIPVQLTYVTIDKNIALTFRNVIKDNTTCFINITTVPENYRACEKGPFPMIGDSFWALVEFDVFNQGENYER